MAFNHVARDEALAAGPAGRRVVEDVLRARVSEVAGERQGTHVDLEAAVGSGLQVVELLAQD